MVKQSNQFGELSEEELSDFEKSNHKKLPFFYRDFLLKNNGGEPIKQRNRHPSTIVTYILGMHNGDYFASLYKHIEMLKNRLPFDTFAIATDPFGNLFLMSLHSENFGQIFFWDHENEPSIQDGHQTGNVSFVSYSFEEFIENLY
jgi:hypothetical protein